MKFFPDQPFKTVFLLSSGQDRDRSEADVRKTVEDQVKYFLAALTIPEKDIWVNLSPFESDRIVDRSLGETDLGRDMLSQDYVLKQLAASLVYPEKSPGKEFWDKVYSNARRNGLYELPSDLFQKVWIVPQKAVVYEEGRSAYVVQADMKVMLDRDYIAEFQGPSQKAGRQETAALLKNGEYEDLLRGSIIPVIQKEVNEGKHFARLRQIFHALILAKWYREKVRGQLLDRIYLNKKKTGGIDIADKKESGKIYDLYVQAYKRGVFNFVKEDPDRLTGEVFPRKYFSGGLKDFGMVALPGVFTITRDPAMAPAQIPEGTAQVAVDMAQVAVDTRPLASYPGHTYLWNLRELGIKHFDQITDEMLRKKKAEGFSVIWWQSIWEESEFSLRYNRYWDPTRDASAYAIKEYKPREDYGGEAAFRRLVARAKKAGLISDVDIVPGHIAADSSWVHQYPDDFIQAPDWWPDDRIHGLDYLLEDADFPRRMERDWWREKETPYAKRFNEVFFRANTVLGERKIAHNREAPAIDLPWLDSAAFNWSRRGFRERFYSLFQYVLDLVDYGGVRLDMTHLVTKEDFNNNWRYFNNGHDLVQDEPMLELRQRFQAAGARVHFMAEAYWGREGLLQRLGVDYTYNKFLYEYFMDPEKGHSSRDFMDYLANRGRAPLDYLRRSVYWLENHDDPRTVRVARILGRERLMSAIVLLTTIPGKVLIHNGQMEGWVNDKPNALHAVPPHDEAVDQELYAHYVHMLTLTNTSHFREGDIFWVNGIRDDQGNLGLPEGVFAFERRSLNEQGQWERTLVVINDSHRQQHISGDLDPDQWGIPSGQASAWVIKDQIGAQDEEPFPEHLDLTLKPYEAHVWKVVAKDAAQNEAQGQRSSPTGGIDASRFLIESRGFYQRLIDNRPMSQDDSLPSFSGLFPVAGEIVPADSVKDFFSSDHRNN
jgi:hypothetical protein